MRRFDTVVVIAILAVIVLAVAVDLLLRRSEYVYPGGKAKIVRGVVLSAEPSLSAWEALTLRPKGEVIQRLRVRLHSSGAAAGETVVAENPITGSPVVDRIPGVGDEVLLRIRELGSERAVTLRDLARDRRLVHLAAFVSLVIIIIFGRKGARALGALAVGLVIIFALTRTIMAVQRGVLVLTLGAILLALGATYLILCGRTRKMSGAAGGAFAGLALGGVLALAATSLTGLSGLHDADMMAIRLFSTAHALDFRDLLVAGMLLGTVGVVMDVAIAVASAIAELARARPDLTRQELHSHGMSVGRKVMGSMVMALAMAYMGMKFGMFLLPYAEPETTLMDVIGTERAVAEIVRLLVGIIAVVWTVPATAFLASYVELHGRNVNSAADIPVEG